MHLPAECSRGEESPLIIGAEFRRTVGTGREGEEKPIVERVVDTCESRHQLGLIGAVADRIGLRIARSEVLVAQRFVDEALGRQRRTARLVVLVRVTAHHRQPVLFSESPIERGVGFENDVVVLPVVDRPVTVVEHARLGIFFRKIFVGNLLAVLVIKLRHDIQAGKHVPVHRSERNDVEPLRIVLLQIGQGQRMRIVLGAIKPVIALVVVNREDRVAPVGQSAVVVALVAGDVGAGLHAQIIPQFVLDREISSVFTVGVLDVHTVVEIIVGAGLKHRAVIAALHLHGRVVRHGGRAEHQVVPARVGRPGRLQLRNRGIIDAVGIGRADVSRRQAGVDVAFVREHRHQHRITPKIQFGAESRNGRLLAQRDARHIFLRLARGDEDHAVGSARAVDGRRRSIFEHFHRNDVLRIDLLQIAGVAPGESVDDHQRGV